MSKIKSVLLNGLLLAALTIVPVMGFAAQSAQPSTSDTQELAWWGGRGYWGNRGYWGGYGGYGYGSYGYPSYGYGYSSYGYPSYGYGGYGYGGYGCCPSYGYGYGYGMY